MTPTPEPTPEGLAAFNREFVVTRYIDPADAENFLAWLRKHDEDIESRAWAKGYEDAKADAAAHDAQVAETARKALTDLVVVFDEIDERHLIPGCEAFVDPDGYCRVCTARQNAELILARAAEEADRG